MSKPYSESCDQNRDVILSIIEPLLKSASTVFEIGSGTGQHAVYFAEKLPHLVWQTSDRAAYLDGIRQWISDSKLKNIRPPVELDVSENQWPHRDQSAGVEVDAVFTANTVHIMNQTDTDNMISGVAALLRKGGSLIIYGPFNYDGQYTSESNARFDQWLKQRDPQSGIKNIETLLLSAQQQGLALVSDYAMPANNRILHFQKAI